jgi:hypothetical protein
VVSEVQRLFNQAVEADAAAIAVLPRECPSMLVTMPSARLPCSAILAR